jgi:hypothetical protein
MLCSSFFRPRNRLQRSIRGEWEAALPKSLILGNVQTTSVDVWRRRVRYADIGITSIGLNRYAVTIRIGPFRLYTGIYLSLTLRLLSK